MASLVMPHLAALILILSIVQPQLLRAYLWHLQIWKRRSILYIAINRRFGSVSGTRARMPGMLLDLVTLVLCAGTLASITFLPPKGLPVALGLLLSLTLLAVWDIRYLRLPDRLTVPLILAGLVEAWSVGTLLQVVWVASVTGLLLLCLREAFRRIRHVNGLGLGDVKLCVGMAAWLDPEMISPAIFAATVFAIIGHFFVRLLAEDAPQLQPFGPSLAVSFWVTFLCQNLVRI